MPITVVSRKSHEDRPITVGAGSSLTLVIDGRPVHRAEFTQYGYVLETIVFEIVDEPGVAKRAMGGAFVFEAADY